MAQKIERDPAKCVMLQLQLNDLNKFEKDLYSERKIQEGKRRTAQANYNGHNRAAEEARIASDGTGIAGNAVRRRLRGRTLSAISGSAGAAAQHHRRMRDKYEIELAEIDDAIRLIDKRLSNVNPGRRKIYKEGERLRCHLVP